MSYLIAQFPQDQHLNVVYKPTDGLPARAALISTAVPAYADEFHPDSPCRRAAFDLGFALKNAFLAEVNGKTPFIPAHGQMQVRSGRIDNPSEAETKKEKTIAALASKHGFNGAIDYWTVNHIGSHGPVRAATIILPANGPLNGHGIDTVERVIARAKGAEISI